MAVSAVIGSAFAVPRMPSVPKSLRTVNLEVRENQRQIRRAGFVAHIRFDARLASRSLNDMKNPLFHNSAAACSSGMATTDMALVQLRLDRAPVWAD
jgi:hypothetical protein